MNLTIEQMRKIVDGAPRWALSHCSQAEYYFAMVAGDFDCCRNLSDLRAAIADHDRTDYVSDIRNHISPMTIVQGDL